MPEYANAYMPMHCSGINQHDFPKYCCLTGNTDVLQRYYLPCLPCPLSNKHAVRHALLDLLRVYQPKYFLVWGSRNMGSRTVSTTFPAAAISSCKMQCVFTSHHSTIVIYCDRYHKDKPRRASLLQLKSNWLVNTDSGVPIHGSSPWWDLQGVTRV